jgi:hypothetical protein
MPNCNPEYLNVDIYKPRNPKTSQYYKCVESHFEELEMIWEDHYEKQYGFWRSWVKNVMLSVLDVPSSGYGFKQHLPIFYHRSIPPRPD